MNFRDLRPVISGLAVMFFLSPVVALAAPPLTAIQDILYKADGTPFTGTVIIEWRTFSAPDSSLIARNRVQQRISNGLLSVRLVPTTTAGASAYYTVRYVSANSTQFTEAWAVRPSASALRVADVRIPDPLLGPVSAADQSSGVTIDQVTGLRGELDIRPRQAIGYMPDRAAIINFHGELAAATGSLSDCLRVDGSTGPCGAGGVGTAAFVDAEVPGGVIDGSNAAFTLSQAPSPAVSLLLYRNGLLMKAGLDYTLSGTNIGFVAGATPQPGDVLLASYRTAN
jgi:hypothetical protein